MLSNNSKLATLKFYQTFQKREQISSGLKIRIKILEIWGTKNKSSFSTRAFLWRRDNKMFTVTETIGLLDAI